MANAVILIAVVFTVACGATAPPGTNASADQVRQSDGQLKGPVDAIEMTTEEGKALRFESTASGSFGPKATRILVGEADGLEPRVASCSGVTAANFHRDSPLGHHFQPELFDLKEAFTRTKEIVEEVSYWPRCPMAWEVQDRNGANYRYCARKKGETTDPPRPAGC
jgi:hypothetical protein